MPLRNSVTKTEVSVPWAIPFHTEKPTSSCVGIWKCAHGIACFVSKNIPYTKHGSTCKIGTLYKPHFLCFLIIIFVLHCEINHLKDSSPLLDYQQSASSVCCNYFKLFQLVL